MATSNYQKPDYDSLFGAEPFSSKRTEIETLINQLREKLAQSRQEAYTGVNDPAVQDYMNYSVSEQKKLLDDYVRAAAGAGIKRGGFGVMGGPRLDSALKYSAIQSLAKDFSSRLSQALSQGSKVKDSQRKQYQEDMLNLQKLLSLQKRYLEDEADWKEKLAQAIRQDWEKQIEWARQDQITKSQAEAEQSRYRADQLKAEAEMKRSQQEMDQKRMDEAQWNSLMKKARLVDSVGRFGAAWTAADDYNLKRLRAG